MFRDMLKYVISQFFVITVGILFVTGISNSFAILNGEGVMEFQVTYPYLVILTGFLSSLPTCLLWFKEEPTKRQCYIRMGMHFVAVEVIVLLEGLWFGWYQNFSEGLKLFGIVIFVFLFVYAYSYFANKDTADTINEALAKFHQEENEEEEL